MDGAYWKAEILHPRGAIVIHEGSHAWPRCEAMDSLRIIMLMN